MRTLKHIGKMAKTKENVLVVFRTLPGDSGSALVLPTAGLSDLYHDAVNQLVESIQAQESFEFGEILFTRMFPDGRPMLRALRADGLMHKVPTDSVVMMPTPNDEILLSDLNVLIAEQRNCAVDDLCQFVSGAKANAAANEHADPVNDLGRDVGEPSNARQHQPQPAVAPLQANQNSVLSDADIARSYRSQAEALLKEAAELRKQADDLDPPAVVAEVVQVVESKPVATVQTKPVVAKTATKVTATKAPVSKTTTAKSTTAAKTATKPNTVAKSTVAESKETSEA